MAQHELQAVQLQHLSLKSNPWHFASQNLLFILASCLNKLLFFFSFFAATIDESHADEQVCETSYKVAHEMMCCGYLFFKIH